MRYQMTKWMKGMGVFAGNALHYHRLSGNQRHDFWKMVQMTGMLAVMPLFIFSGIVLRMLGRFHISNL